ncbi:MAG TPA: hypothetical protein PKD50_03515, partial [Leptospiraceae bacterium]|nr:hypothetical protein [Leptospiraceae bacterium]
MNQDSITLSTQKISFPRKDFIYSEFSSTLLLPDRYSEIFYAKCKYHGGVREYISYLLSRYQLFIANGLVPGYSNVTTKYQE